MARHIRVDALCTNEVLVTIDNVSIRLDMADAMLLQLLLARELPARVDPERCMCCDDPENHDCNACWRRCAEEMLDNE